MAKQFEGDVDKDNHLLRGLLMNQKQSVQQVAAATNSSVDPSTLPWDNLIFAHEKVTTFAIENKTTALAQFLASCLGPLGKALRKGLENRRFLHAMTALGVASEKPVVMLSPRGTRGAFLKQASRYYLKSRPDLYKNPKLLESELYKEMKVQEVRGYPMGDSYEGSVVALIDVEQAANAPKGLDPKAAAAWAAKTIRTPEQIEELNLSSWRQKLDQVGGGIGKGVPVIAGIAAGLLEFVCITKMSHELSQSLARDKGMNTARCVAAAGAFGGTVVNVVGTTAELTGKAELLGTGKALANFGRTFARIGAGIGCVAGLAMAVMDFIEFYKSVKSEQYGLAAVYLISGLAGGGASICFFLIAIGYSSAWLPIAGWILAGIAFAAAIIISLIKDNKIQEWLEYCTWGTREQYKTMHDEIHELNLALGV